MSSLIRFEMAGSEAESVNEVREGGMKSRATGIGPCVASCSLNDVNDWKCCIKLMEPSKYMKPRSREVRESMGKVNESESRSVTGLLGFLADIASNSELSAKISPTVPGYSSWRRSKAVR